MSVYHLDPDSIELGYVIMLKGNQVGTTIIIGKQLIGLILSEKTMDLIFHALKEDYTCLLSKEVDPFQEQSP